MGVSEREERQVKRPWQESAVGGEVKRLLTASMQLPESSWSQATQQRTLHPFVHLFMDPILSNKQLSDIYGVEPTGQSGTARASGTVFVTFLPAWRFTEVNLSLRLLHCCKDMCPDGGWMEWGSPSQSSPQL